MLPAVCKVTVRERSHFHIEGTFIVLGVLNGEPDTTVGVREDAIRCGALACKLSLRKLRDGSSQARCGEEKDSGGDGLGEEHVGGNLLEEWACVLFEERDRRRDAAAVEFLFRLDVLMC
jgi:hypothetical protein